MGSTSWRLHCLAQLALTLNDMIADVDQLCTGTGPIWGRACWRAASWRWQNAWRLAAHADSPAIKCALGPLLQVGTCLLESCQLALASCLADGNCLQDLVCLNSCNGEPPNDVHCAVGSIRFGLPSEHVFLARLVHGLLFLKALCCPGICQCAAVAAAGRPDETECQVSTATMDPSGHV